LCAIFPIKAFNTLIYNTISRFWQHKIDYCRSELYNVQKIIAGNGGFAVDFDAGKVRVLEKGAVTLPARRRDVNKYDCGRVLAVGGSAGYTGAPVMCAASALRAGAGLVYLAVPQSIYPIAAGKLLEAMPFPLPDDGAGRFSENALPVLLDRLKKCEVCVIGPGLGRSEALTALVLRVMEECAVPLVLDADALFAASQDMSVFKRTGCRCIVTPHTGEFRRMGGKLSGEPAADAAAFTAEYGCVTVLKGPETAVAFPDGDVFVSRLGNPGMASGGTGDVLAGLIAGLAAQLPIKTALTAAVYIHGTAGDVCAEEYGEYSMLPGDMIKAIPGVMKNMTR
jgi:hydroxyethylthiazole kinase-like uncharacterized protein yjeF